MAGRVARASIAAPSDGVAGDRDRSSWAGSRLRSRWLAAAVRGVDNRSAERHPTRVASSEAIAGGLLNRRWLPRPGGKASPCCPGSNVCRRVIVRSAPPDRQGWRGAADSGDSPPGPRPREPPSPRTCIPLEGIAALGCAVGKSSPNQVECFCHARSTAVGSSVEAAASLGWSTTKGWSKARWRPRRGAARPAVAHVGATSCARHPAPSCGRAFPASWALRPRVRAEHRARLRARRLSRRPVLAAVEPRPSPRRGGASSGPRARHDRRGVSAGTSGQSRLPASRPGARGSLSRPCFGDAARGSERAALRVAERATARRGNTARSGVVGAMVRWVGDRAGARLDATSSCAGTDLVADRRMATPRTDRSG